MNYINGYPPFRESGCDYAKDYPMPYQVPMQTCMPQKPSMPSPMAQGPTNMPMPSQAQSGEISASTIASIQYLAGFLKTQIGKRMRVQFLIGTNLLVDKSGILVSVGASYIVLNETESKTNIVCDLYSIKFVNVFD